MSKQRFLGCFVIRGTRCTEGAWAVASQRRSELAERGRDPPGKQSRKTFNETRDNSKETDSFRTILKLFKSGVFFLSLGESFLFLSAGFLVVGQADIQ